MGLGVLFDFWMGGGAGHFVFSLLVDTPAFAAIHGNRRTNTHIPLRAAFYFIYLEIFFFLVAP